MRLVQKELVQIRSQILQALGLMAVGALFADKIAEDLVEPVLFAIPVALAMTLPQTIFDQEERGNTYVFLRALPIRPCEIVAAKYAVSVIATLASMAMIGLAWSSGSLSREATFAFATGIGLLSFVLSALSLFFHFWLGTKSAKTALMITTACGMIVPLIFVLGARGKGGMEAAFGKFASRIVPLATSSLGPLLSLATGLAIMGASLAASVSIFTRRDLSRLP